MHAISRRRAGGAHMEDAPIAELLVGGRHIAAQSGRAYERLNPVTGRVATRAAAATPRDAVKAAEAAQEAFPAWSALGPNARRDLLIKAAEELAGLADAFVSAMCDEVGATE